MGQYEPNFRELPTFVYESALAGANNKDMLSFLNPTGSGKIIRIWRMWAVVPSSSGATVIIPFEIRRCTAVSGGTLLTAVKMDDVNDPDAVAEVKAAPTGITDSAAPVVAYTWIEQINTAQGGSENMTHAVHSSGGGQTKPFILNPGKGLYLRQIATNTSTFRMGVLTTEE